MPADYELYRWVDAHIPASVGRELAQIDLDAGEPEVAILELIDCAAAVGELPDEVVERLRIEYPDGGYRRIIDEVARYANRG